METTPCEVADHEGSECCLGGDCQSLAKTFVSRDGHQTKSESGRGRNAVEHGELTSVRAQQTGVVPVHLAVTSTSSVEGRRDGEANGDSVERYTKKGQNHVRESGLEAITRTRVVRASSSATWDRTATLLPDESRKQMEQPSHSRNPHMGYAAARMLG